MMTAETKHHDLIEPQWSDLKNTPDLTLEIGFSNDHAGSFTPMFKVRTMKFEVHHKIQRSNYHTFFHITQPTPPSKHILT